MPLAAIVPEDAEFFETQVRPLLVEHCAECHSARAGDPEGVEAWHKLEKAALMGDKRVNPVMAVTPNWALLETIRHPFLLATGDSDLYVPPSLLRMQASHVAHAEVHVIAEAGHSPYWEQPRAFNAMLIDFLRRVGR